MGALAESSVDAELFFLRMQMPEHKSVSTGYLIGVSATVLLSFSGICISYLRESFELPPLVLAFLRNITVASLLLIFFALFSPRRLRLDRRHWGFFAFYAFAVSLFNAAWTFSVAFNGAAVATVLAFCSPAMTAVMAHFLLKEEINCAKIVSIVLGLAGTVLVSGAADPAMWRLNPGGIVFGVLTGVALAVYNILGKTSANRNVDPWTTMLYGFGGAMLFLFAYAALQNLIAGSAPLAHFGDLGVSTSGWAVLLALAIGPTIGGFGLQLVSMGYLPATVANVIGALEPAFTTSWAFLLWGKFMTPIQLAGSLTVLASVVILRLGEPHPEQAASAQPVEP